MMNSRWDVAADKSSRHRQSNSTYVQNQIQYYFLSIEQLPSPVGLDCQSRNLQMQIKLIM